MLFWFTLIGLTGLVLLVLAAALARGKAPGTDRAEVAIYRDQLAEVGRDLARGVVDAGEAVRLRTEVQRRLLDADRTLTATTGTAPGVARWALIAAVPVGVALVAALYASLGAPNHDDLPRTARMAASAAIRANRPSQAQAEAAVPMVATGDPDPGYLRQIAALRQAVAGRPDDLTGHSLLAQNEAAIGRFAAAARAQARVVALKGDGVTAADQAMLANLLILAAGGMVSAEAEAALTEALRRDPANGAARYYSGLLFAQIDRPDLAYRIWRPLYDQSGPDDPWTEALRLQLDLAAAAAGVDYRVPAAIRGPDAGAVADAATMNTEDRNAMIAAMVEGLAARLAASGGSAAEWAQLIGSYGVLGQGDKAAAAWASASAAFAAAPADLATVRAAAVAAGVEP